MGIEPTSDRIRGRSPVLKTGQNTSPDSPPSPIIFLHPFRCKIILRCLLRRQGPWPDERSFHWGGITLTCAESNDKIKVDRPPEILQPPKLSAIPLEIQNLNLKGSMEFKLLVDVDGTVRKVTVSKSSGNDQIDQFVIPFLQKSIWTPAVKTGTPIACWRKLSISFYTLACKFDFIDLY